MALTGHPDRRTRMTESKAVVAGKAPMPVEVVAGKA
jgi:hypothetical protein